MSSSHHEGLSTKQVKREVINGQVVASRVFPLPKAIENIWKQIDSLQNEKNVDNRYKCRKDGL